MSSEKDQHSKLLPLSGLRFLVTRQDTPESSLSELLKSQGAEVLAAEYDDVSMANSNNTTTSVSVEDMMGASARISLVKSF